MPEVSAKMLSQITNNNAVANHKQQCCLLKVLCDLKQSNKKKVIAHEDCQEFSFLYRRTLKQMKQKRSSGNVVHLSVTFDTSSSFEETAPNEEKMALRRTLQPNINAVILKIKKRCLQLPKSSEKMP